MRPSTSRAAPFREKATLAGKTVELSGEAKPGVVTSVAIAFDAVGAEVPPPLAEPKSSVTVWKPLTYVLGGATLVSGALALYFNAKSSSALDRSTALRNEHAGSNCQVATPAPFCGDIAPEDSGTRSAASASKGMWIGAGVLLALTGVSGDLWATSGASRASCSGAARALIPTAGPSTAGAAFRVSL